MCDLLEQRRKTATDWWSCFIWRWVSETNYQSVWCSGTIFLDRTVLCYPWWKINLPTTLFKRWDDLACAEEFLNAKTRFNHSLGGVSDFPIVWSVRITNSNSFGDEHERDIQFPLLILLFIKYLHSKHQPHAYIIHACVLFQLIRSRINEARKNNHTFVSSQSPVRTCQ